FRGRLVDSHESPARVEHVLAELRRRPLGALHEPVLGDAELMPALRAVHEPRYLEFLQGAWADWVALDPANAAIDALPSVWPLPNRHGFRQDGWPRNIAARLGQFAFDSGTP